MQTLTVTSKGQVTLRKEVLKHLGVQPGEKVSVALQPDGQVTVSAIKTRKDISSVFGILKTPKQKSLSIAQISRIIADGWAGKR